MHSDPTGNPDTTWSCEHLLCDEIFQQWHNQTLQNACSSLLRNRCSPMLSHETQASPSSFLCITFPWSSLFFVFFTRQGNYFWLICFYLKCGRTSQYGTVHSVCVGHSLIPVFMSRTVIWSYKVILLTVRVYSHTGIFLILSTGWTEGKRVSSSDQNQSSPCFHSFHVSASCQATWLSAPILFNINKYCVKEL